VSRAKTQIPALHPPQWISRQSQQRLLKLRKAVHYLRSDPLFPKLPRPLFQQPIRPTPDQAALVPTRQQTQIRLLFQILRWKRQPAMWFPILQQ
jgi:hypothetical protein